MSASKKILQLVREEQRKVPGLSHELAYRKVSAENPKAIEAFLVELGVKTRESTKTE